MSRSKPRRRRSRAHRDGSQEINVVPFIDMMIILVFFLIFTAVFTKTHILELDLPAAQTAVPSLPQGLNLEVIVRDSVIEVADRATGVMKRLPAGEDGHDLQGLSEYLQLVKSRYPEHEQATILMEQTIAYEVLVQVMDVVRVFQVPGSQWAFGELFPQISVGDAPA